MKKNWLVLLCVFVCGGLYAQDFGFGFDDDDDAASGSSGSTSSAASVKLGGEIAAEFLGYVHDFKKGNKPDAAMFGDMISGALNFSASGANVDAYIGLNLSAASFRNLAAIPDEPAATPLILDEAFVRAFFGPVNIEAGYRKLSWGKADSFGPLDIVNPVDYTDLTNISDIQAIKIARPMVHISGNIKGFSKLEAVFIPNFTGYRFAYGDRWEPSLFTTMPNTAKKGVLREVKRGFPSQIQTQLGPIPIGPFIDNMSSMFAADTFDFSPSDLFPDTSGLGYFQTGLRFTTTVGSVDIGAQYFYGNLFQPDFTIGGVHAFVNDLKNKNQPLLDSIPNLSPEELLGLMANPPNFDTSGLVLLSPRIKYNRYHQLGIDYAQVLLGFNVRAEFAAHLTEDLKGNDGSVRNPFLGWSFGFDRDIVWGININMQINETIRLLNSKVGKNPVLDCEADTNITSSRVTMQVSRRFLRDELETKAIVIWDIENSDCYVIPAIVWTIKDVTAELAAGVFAGKEGGDLQQYWRNSFIKLGLKYSF